MKLEIIKVLEVIKLKIQLSLKKAQNYVQKKEKKKDQ